MSVSFWKFVYFMTGRINDATMALDGWAWKKYRDAHRRTHRTGPMGPDSS